LHKKPEPAPDHYAVVIISDLHLGTRFGASEMLCEFLDHTRCDKLILNGDIVDGRHLNHRRPKNLPEGQKRVLDAINRKIAEGTEVTYIPGNHDITLRRINAAGKSVEGVKIAESLDFVDPKGRKFLILHGDQFDAREVRAERMADWKLAMLGRADEIMTRASRFLDKVTDKVLHRKFNVAAKIRSAFEHDRTAHVALEEKATAHVKEKGYDGVICGHTHTPANKTRNGVFYMNSGDWVEGFTALTMDKDGNWAVVPWKERRQELGLKHKFFAAMHHNPDAEFRPKTDRMLAAIKSIWPGKGVKKQLPKPPGA
jgi:UDP-2,3-diacylglucosamine pyrophosphatase LpxH